MNKFAYLAPTILRIGISLVFLWFGYSQVSDQVQWVLYVPESIVNLSKINAETLVLLNGIFEIVFGTALLLGFWTRTAALLLALHMFEIVYIVGFDATGVRDFGIAVAAVAVFLHGKDGFTLDALIAQKDSDGQVSA
ncbi:MAG: DoxX family protein [Patescibacteria group bacterium]